MNSAHSLLPSSALLGALLALTLCPQTPSQKTIQYGAHESGSITAPGATAMFYLLGAQAGTDVLVTFCSQNSGWPNYTYYHKLEIWDGATLVGTVSGHGAKIINLPKTTIYTIRVQAINTTSTGWFVFQIDRLRNPVAADSIALNWNMKGVTANAASFTVFTLRGNAGSTARLTFSTQNSGWPDYTPYNYANLYDATGAVVDTIGNNGSTAGFVFPATGLYTLFVAAHNYESTGSFSISVDCLSAPGVPCDTQPDTSTYCHYCPGHPGTNGIPSLTANTPPKAGTTCIMALGNSSGAPTQGWLLFGLQPASVATTLGGSLCVSPPLVVVPVPSLPATGGTLPIPIPSSPLLIGYGFALQWLVLDPGASQQLAFSCGVKMITG